MRAERVQSTKPSHTPDDPGTRSRSWTRIAGWAPVLILAALLLLPAASADPSLKDQVEGAKDTAGDLADKVADRVGSPGSLLFFTEQPLDEPDQRWNFTASPPGNEAAATGTHRDAELQDTDGFQATWSWYLPTTPVTWTARPGDQWEFVLFIEGLAATPGGEDTHPIYTIDIQAISSEGVHANGTTETSRLDFGGGPHRYTLIAQVDEHHQFYPGKSDPQVEIRITVTTKADASPDVKFHYGTLENPSRLTLPRYPHDALDEMRNDPPAAGDVEPPCADTPAGDTCAQDPDPDNGNDGGSDPQSGPQDPSGPGTESASTVKTGDSAGPGLQEQAPEEDSRPETKEKGPDAISTASTSGVIVLLAWTLFVASAGSYGRSDRTKQQGETPRIVGRPKQTSGSSGRSAQETPVRTRKDERKD